MKGKEVSTMYGARIKVKIPYSIFTEAYWWLLALKLISNFYLYIIDLGEYYGFETSENADKERLETFKECVMVFKK